MKIFIGADCRAIRIEKGKKNLTWMQLLQKDKRLDIQTVDRQKTIWEVAETIKGFGFFDLVIVQVGHYEHHVSWTPEVWKIIVPNFNSNNLVKSDSKYPKKKKNKQRLYWYFDNDLLKNSIEKIRSKTKNLLLVGVHSWLKGANKEMWSTYGHHEMGLHLNDSYSSFDIDYFNFPMHYSWVKANCYDTFHYNKDGQIFIYNYIRRYIERINFSINSLIKEKQ
ncbi:MAG: hypothetical protein WC755_02140 [Candidatus Woesearchaeota archaeon]